ncbi:ELL [Acanthosepion pharaonis]|uniref:ELL n=1 Tax=Acanthosepion pharaonis TaxID=158019 RepID=A0A812CQP9_ACAPH|nr:ELL [Sepia pharaonis]
MEEVATQYKENKYTLAKRTYSEVQLDWPYYAEGERQLVRSHPLSSLKSFLFPSPQHLFMETSFVYLSMWRIATDGRSASNSPEESSPHYSNNLPNSGSPYGVNNAQKRGSSADIQAAKKMRVSPPTVGERQQQNGVSLKKPVVKMLGQHQPPIITPNNNSVTHSHLMNGLKVPSPSSSPDIDTLNYLSKYSVICGDSQRQEYKNDFNTEYFEYQKLYQEINKVSQKFLDWDNQMKNLNKGSPAYEKLERKIVNEYHQTKKDTKFIQTKNRFEFLHRKLGHIKKLVVDYDQKQMASLKS